MASGSALHRSGPRMSWMLQIWGAQPSEADGSNQAWQNGHFEQKSRKSLRCAAVHLVEPEPISSHDGYYGRKERQCTVWLKPSQKACWPFKKGFQAARNLYSSSHVLDMLPSKKERCICSWSHLVNSAPIMTCTVPSEQPACSSPWQNGSKSISEPSGNSICEVDQ